MLNEWEPRRCSINVYWEFPGSPVVRTRHFHCWGPGSIPGWGTKIPQAAQSGQKKKMFIDERLGDQIQPPNILAIILAQAAITKYHKLGSLNNMLFLTVLKAGSPRSKC